MNETNIGLISLCILQPSQLYINQEKLAVLQATFDFSAPENIPPIPIKNLAGCLIMTDGHTRAFAAYKASLQKIPFRWDEDDLDWEAYLICVRWCQDAGIYSIGDLKGWVVSPDTYTTQWLMRCQQMQRDLARNRTSNNDTPPTNNFD